MVLLCSAAASVFITPLLVRTLAGANYSMRVDVFAELAAAFAASAIMLRSIDRREWSAIDFSRRSARPRPMLAGFLVGAAAIGAASAVLFAAGMMHFVPSPVHASFAAATFRVTLVLTVAALAEEIICRGYLLTVIREAFGVRTAVVSTSVMFGLLHMTNPGATATSVTVVTLSGLLLAMVRLTYDSLYAAWMAHLAWNWVMAVPLHADVSGIRFESPGYRAVTDGPAWLSGGAWGPEGGLIAAGGLTAALVYFYARHRREESKDRG